MGAIGGCFRTMIVTIDGPAGAGKSTVARGLAKRLGFRFLDTGAMYRCVALAALRRGVAIDDPAAMVALAGSVAIDVTEDRVLLDGEDVTPDIRTLEVTSATHYAADNPGVRARLVQLQQQIGQRGDYVTEGRDQGTVVFPEAERKVFLTASAEERARRRVDDLASRGETADFDDVLEQQNLRDRRDTSRDVGPLVAAEDAIEICTDGLTVDDVVERLEADVRKRT